jgi:hypothetical protein
VCAYKNTHALYAHYARAHVGAHMHTYDTCTHADAHTHICARTHKRTVIVVLVGLVVLVVLVILTN